MKKKQINVVELTTFRGKRTISGKWIEGFYSCIDGFHYIMADFTAGNLQIVDRETVGIRVDGIHDKNGKDIFVGDIVEVDFGDELGGKMLSKVVYSKKYGCFNLEYIDGGVNGFPENFIMEVIGNVYDNPELLEVTE